VKKVISTKAHYDQLICGAYHKVM